MYVHQRGVQLRALCVTLYTECTIIRGRAANKPYINLSISHSHINHQVPKASTTTQIRGSFWKASSHEMDSAMPKCHCSIFMNTWKDTDSQCKMQNALYPDVKNFLSLVKISTLQILTLALNFTCTDLIQDFFCDLFFNYSGFIMTLKSNRLVQIPSWILFSLIWRRAGLSTLIAIPLHVIF